MIQSKKHCIFKSFNKLLLQKRPPHPKLSTKTNDYDSDYALSISEPEKYWASKVDLIDWFEKPKRILSGKENSPFERWFEGGKVNAAHNCVDVHVRDGHGSQTAIIHDSPMTSTQAKMSYKELLDEVSLFAGVLAKHGVEKGDRVLIYMPMIPQTTVAMLAAVRLGAIHAVVFGGFASKELAVRINHAKPKVIVSVNFGVEPSRLINYQELLQQAIEISAHKPLKSIFYNRKMFPEVDMKNNRDTYLNWAKELDTSKAHECVPVDSNHPLYLLYTSGTTGTPKGVVRPTAGYLMVLKQSMQQIYGVEPGETWWSMSDFGWTVGHSYGAYAPLLARNSTVLFEGKPVGTPDPGAVWRVIEEHDVVGTFLTPTALRAIIQQDPDASHSKKYSLEKLKFMFLAGEHCDHETLRWAKSVVKKPVIDHWWQTETGYPMTAMFAGGMMKHNELHEMPAGVSGKAVPGFDIRVLNETTNEEAKPGELGRIVVKMPLPPGTILSLWENDALFKSTYFESYPGYYDTADVGFKSAEGYLTIMSRADDVINVAGHRLSSMALEEAILSHPELSDCAVVELDDQMKGVVPFGFLIRNSSSQSSDAELLNGVYNVVREEIGPVASFKQAIIVKKLPKTKSGKIARNTLKAMINNKPYKIPVTIEDPLVYGDIKTVLLKNNFTFVSDASV